MIPRKLLEPILGLVGMLVVLLVTSFALVRGWLWVCEVPYQLATGWLKYLGRVRSEMHPDEATIVFAEVCGAGFVVGAHVFLRWLASSVSAEWPGRRTLQLVVLVVMMFVSGTAVVGMVQQTSWLVRTPEPLLYDNRSIR